ncbi:MAG: 16S rRNA (adenine(1518)-N(6)/adenine(1519)-N(6))-dimethyltransferase RsmA [Christensenella sp.]|nr:16S rRNA (adenine(1518)-N(6)/adenine(1519)-N(6))-dimethyltransferase RsmA [Christensenella sp.]
MSSIIDTLKKNNFRFNKQFGQNFITDQNLLRAIVDDAKITKDDVVVEIGPGAGTLTKEIAKKAKEVFSFEIDNNLAPILNETLQDCPNSTVIFKDFQKVDDEQLNQILNNREYKVVANLPYYITTPIIMKFIESTYPPKSITVMVQKEVAERLKSNALTSEIGAISLSIALYGDVEMTRVVSRKMFMPEPNVDSAVIRIDMQNKYDNIDKKPVKKLIKAAFNMRRKTFLNNISNAFNISKDRIKEVLKELNIDENIRGEAVSIDNYIAIAKKLGIN